MERILNTSLHKKILLVYNPVAGRARTAETLESVLEVFSEAGYNVTLCGTGKDKSATDLVSEFCEKSFDTIVCCGGDGTLNETINGVLLSQSDLPIGYIPCGTTNDFAKGVGIPLSPKKAAEAIVSGETRAIDIGSWESDGTKKHFSYIASFGAFTDVSYSTPQRIKNMFGHMSYLVGGVPRLFTLMTAPTYHVQLETPGGSLEGDYIFGAVSNTRSIGGVIKLKNDDIKLDDGLFEAIFIKKPQNTAQLNELVSTAASGDLHTSKIIDVISLSEITMTINAGPWSLDGERVEAKERVHVKNLQRSVNIIVSP